LDDPDSPYCALLLAYAGLHRLGWDDRITQILNEDVLLHAVGQGAIGIECREEDSFTRDILAPLNHSETRLRAEAEREFMKKLEGGCSIPLGVYSEYSVDSQGCSKLELRGSVTSLDGSEQIADSVSGVCNETDMNALMKWASELGISLGLKLQQLGAQKLLNEIKQ
jgi:hydroxymethylbilane synthase